MRTTLPVQKKMEGKAPLVVRFRRASAADNRRPNRQETDEKVSQYVGVTPQHGDGNSDQGETQASKTVRPTAIRLRFEPEDSIVFIGDFIQLLLGFRFPPHFFLISMFCRLSRNSFWRVAMRSGMSRMATQSRWKASGSGAPSFAERTYSPGNDTLPCPSTSTSLL